MTANLTFPEAWGIKYAQKFTKHLLRLSSTSMPMTPDQMLVIAYVAGARHARTGNAESPNEWVFRDRLRRLYGVKRQPS